MLEAYNRFSSITIPADILSGDDTLNMEISKKLLEANILHVIALVNEPGNLDEFIQAGIQVYSPGLYRSTLITLMARNPSMFNLLISTSDARDMMELSLRNPIFPGQRNRDLILPGDSLILSIKRDGEILIPHGSTRLKINGQVSVLVENTEIHKVMDMFQLTTGH